MAFSEMYNHARIQPILNYADAEERYKSIKPIRGRSQEVKPLGERRYDQYRIEKRITVNQFENKEYVSYACVLYDTDCVTFHPDNTITLQFGYWSSMTTRAFIRNILYRYGNIDSQRGKWYWVNHMNSSAYLFDKPLKLKLEDNVLVPTEEPKPEYIHRVRRKVLNQLRKKYAFFIEYGVGMLSLNDKVDRLELAEASHGLSFQNARFEPYRTNYRYLSNNNPTPEQNRANLFQALDIAKESGNVELLYELTCIVAHTAGGYSYYTNAVICKPATFKKYVDELIKYEFCEQIFDKIEVSNGVRFHDENAKYFGKTL